MTHGAVHENLTPSPSPMPVPFRPTGRLVRLTFAFYQSPSWTCAALNRFFACPSLRYPSLGFEALSFPVVICLHEFLQHPVSSFYFPRLPSRLV